MKATNGDHNLVKCVNSSQGLYKATELNWIWTKKQNHSSSVQFSKFAINRALAAIYRQHTTGIASQNVSVAKYTQYRQATKF